MPGQSKIMGRDWGQNEEQKESNAFGRCPLSLN